MNPKNRELLVFEDSDISTESKTNTGGVPEEQVGEGNEEMDVSWPNMGDIPHSRAD